MVKQKSLLRLRAKRVNQEASITKLLAEFRYDVMEDMREQQFRCDLHGSRDSRPSARVYPQTNSFHCFACAKSRGPVSFLMERKEIGFVQAVEYLERWANLPILEGLPEDFEEEDEGNTEDSETFLEAKIHAWLLQLSRDREIPLEKTLKFWEAFDLIQSLKKEKGESWTRIQLSLIEGKIQDEIRSAR